MTDSKGDPYIENLFQIINEKNAEITRLRAELSTAYERAAAVAETYGGEYFVEYKSRIAKTIREFGK